MLVNIREKCKTSQTSLESDDWSNFQDSLRVIQTCGDLIMHMDDFDGRIISSVMHSVGQHHCPTSPGKEMGIFRWVHKYWLFWPPYIEQVSSGVFKCQ